MSERVNPAKRPFAKAGLPIASRYHEVRTKRASEIPPIAVGGRRLAEGRNGSSTLTPWRHEKTDNLLRSYLGRVVVDFSTTARHDHLLAAAQSGSS